MKQLELFKKENYVTKYKQVNFTPDEFEASVERATYQKGWMAVVAGPGVVKQSADKDDLDVSPNWYGLSVTLTPLSNPDDASTTVGRGITVWSGVPKEPDTWEDAVEAGKLPAEIDPEDPKGPSLEYWRNILKMYAQKTHALFNAAFGDNAIPAKPYKANGKWYLNGEEVDVDTAKETGAEALNVAVEKSCEMVENNDASAFEGCVFYAECVYEKDNRNGEDRPVFKNFSNTHPIRNRKPVELLTGAAIMAKPVREKSEEEAPVKKAPAKKKTSSKKKAA